MAMAGMIKKLFVALTIALVAGCGGDNAFSPVSSPSGGSPTGPKASNISLSTTQNSVKSDNSNNASITATVLDASNAALPGIAVAFSASGGQLSASSATTNAQGQATVVFASGTSDPANRTATVTANAAGLTPVQIPVVVNGSTISIVSDKPSSLVLGGANGADRATLTITAKNAANVAVFNTPITFSVAGSGSSPGAAIVTPASATTDINGQTTATLTATSPGTVTVTASGLGYTATKDFVITQNGAAFVITSPSNPATLQIDQPLTVTVRAPTQASVTFTSTLGTWDGGSSSLVTKAVTNGAASAMLSTKQGGTATVQVVDAANADTYATLTVLMSAPSSQAAQIALQSNVSVLAPSIGGTQSQATFTATVRTSSASGGTPVSGAPVSFSLSNTTGGGETISPAYGITDNTGRVTATFTSGSLSSNSQGVQVTATVYDGSSRAVASASRNILINQTAGSVVIGAGSTVGQPIQGGASYSLPMSVVVADSNGNPVQTTVTLSIWPTHYRTGYWTGRSTGQCSPVVTATWDNEDLNRNLILDAGEDVPYIKGVTTAGPSGITAQGYTIIDTGTTDGHGQEIFTVAPASPNGALVGLGGPSTATQQFVTDGILTPGNSAGGTLPATVTTGANGLANFTLSYAKAYSVWIQDEVKATTTVLGTETTGVLPLSLPYVATEGTGCNLFDSPFNPKSPAP